MDPENNIASERRDTQQSIDLNNSAMASNLVHRPTELVINRPFVGRLGGNQAFTLSVNDPNYDEKLRTTPDASPCFTWAETFDLSGFGDIELWKQALLEAWATSMLVWITGLLGYALSSRMGDFSSGPIIPALLGALTNTVSLTLFIFSAGPVSGGHMNPLITMGTFFGRLATFPRAVLYILFQVLGATVGAFLIRAALGQSDTANVVIPGCYIDTSVITAGQAFILETMTCLSLIFLAFGMGLDPRQKAVYGPAFAPVLIGFALGLCTFATGAVKNGYTGACMNPARCFGLMAAEGRWELHWVHWLGAIVATMVNGLFYWVIPPSKWRKL